MHRREFFRRAALGGAGLVTARVLDAQGTAKPQAPATGNTSNLFDMNQDAAKTVRRPARAGAAESMDDEDRDALVREIRCQCGCTLDVYICRTTDFSCQVSPAMHRDIISLVEGGYSAQEILDSFVTTYGERALMAPKREGFNLTGYLMPFAVLGVGAVALTTVLRRMSNRAAPAVIGARVVRSAEGDATDDEMARLNAAIRKDE
ncbi:MAG: cytochrome c-type biogenesis protein CcmH [Polaromonas sp.]|nr:cytochrome c-type biogenesis protein CcmH [Gemmatimonadaceae bacterium]